MMLTCGPRESSALPLNDNEEFVGGNTMPRRGFVPKREVLPDPVHGTTVVTKLINQIMLDGKRGVAQNVCYTAFDMVAEKTGKDANEVGNPDTASSRLNLSQAFNSLGTTLGPAIGGYLIFSIFIDKNANSASGVILPYLFLSLLLLLLAVFIGFVKIGVHKEETTETKHQRSIFSYPYVILGALGIFFYVGAEVSVGSNTVSYLKETMNMPEALASAYLSYYWGGAMIGRFLGSVSLSKISRTKKLLSMLLLSLAGFFVVFTINYSLHGLNFGSVVFFVFFMLLNFLGFYFGKGIPSRLLAVFAFVNVVLIAASMSLSGEVALWSLLAVGLFNSIMWSNVFTLAIEGLENRTAEASSILIMMILGGAVLPPLQGIAADCIGIRYSFLIPMLSYVYLFFYGVKGCKIGKTNSQIR